MKGRASEELLGQLHGAAAQALIGRIESGEATAADFTAALKMLRDNNITCDLAAAPGSVDPMDRLKAAVEELGEIPDFGAH